MPKNSYKNQKGLISVLLVVLVVSSLALVALLVNQKLKSKSLMDLKASPSASVLSYTQDGSLLPAETPPYVDSNGKAYFDPRKIPVELQAWWVPNYGHIHAAANLPLGQEVSGVLKFNVRMVIHNNPSTLKYLAVHTDRGTLPRIAINKKCTYADGTTYTPSKGDLNCAFNQEVSIDTAALKSDGTPRIPDGWREFRIRAETGTPDGKSFLNSSGVPLNVQNGKTDSNYTSQNKCKAKPYTSLTGRSWYTDFGYTNALIDCVPVAPVSGTLTLRIRAQEPSKHLNAVLDRTHAIPAVGPWLEVKPRTGVVLFDKDGNFSAYDVWQTISIDTKQLENGWHSLAVRSVGVKEGTSTCSYCKGELNHEEGVAKMWFFVKN